MSDTKTGDEKTLTVHPKKTLSLKRPGVEQSTVRQNFSHGRTKQVVVETKRKFGKPGEKPEAAAAISVFAPKPPGRHPAARRAGGAEDAAAGRALRHGAERPVDERDRGAPPRARRLEGARGRGPPEGDRRRQAPPRGGGAPQARARGIGTPPGRGGSPPEGRGRIAPPRRGRGAPPRAADCRGGHRRRRGAGSPSEEPRRRDAGAPDRDGGRRQAETEIRGRPPPRQADADLGAVVRRRRRARPFAVGDAPPPGEGQARPAPGAAREGHSRGRPAGDHHHPGSGEPHVRARGRRGEVLHEAGPDHEAGRRHRRRHGGAGRHRIRPHREARRRIRRRGGAVRAPTTASAEPRVAAAGGDHHGPCRPRQDLAARRHPPRQRRVRRGRRHHPAHRRLSGREERPEDHLPRHARPRRLHGDARPRRPGDRHRHPGGGGRRRRHAADDRGDQARQGGRRADHRGDQQDRQARRRSAEGAHRAAAVRRVRRIDGRRGARRRGLGDQGRPVSTSCSRPSCCRPKCSTSRPTRIAPPTAWSSRPSSTRAAARSRPCWSSAAR